ncbi:hypothetical protein CGC21_36410 [Leishmania donovani]|uniref:Uncharacterized protein n=1 Tax=Leishmania donovani TaxID=5661 RepID=A0A504XAC5_LEIDO|nr:hypothetical protein CGC21_36410 [Leishmania donovani]
MNNRFAHPASIAPQAQTSNYPTVHNIYFRSSPLSTLPTRRNTKFKCPSCVVWGEKSTVCKVCLSTIPGPRRIYAPPSSETAKRQPASSGRRHTVVQPATQLGVAAVGATESKRGKSIKDPAPQTTERALNLRVPRSRAFPALRTATAPTPGTPPSTAAQAQQRSRGI